VGGRTNWGEIVKKRNVVLAVTAAMAFVAVAFAGGVGNSGSEQRAHYSDAEFIGTPVPAVMMANYQVPPSNEGE
jgi:hypothetical protein